MSDDILMAASRPGLKAKQGRMGVGDPRRLFLGQETSGEKAQHEAEDNAAEGSPGSVVDVTR